MIVGCTGVAHVNDGSTSGTIGKAYPIKVTNTSGAVYTLPATASSTIAIDLYSHNDTDGYIYNNNSSANASSDFYLCDSAGNNAYKFTTIALGSNAGYVNKHIQVSLSVPNLLGKQLYIKSVITSGKTGTVVLRRAVPITIYIYYPVTAGQKVYKTDLTNNSLNADATYIKSTAFSAGASVDDGTFNTKVGAKPF